MNNVGFIEQKIRGVKELIVDKMYSTLQHIFQDFLQEFIYDKNPLFDNKLIFYCLLKTEGDIMIELGDYNKAL